MDPILSGFASSTTGLITDNFVPVFLAVGGLIIAITVGPRIFHSLLRKFRI